MVHFIFMLLLLGFFTPSNAADPGETGGTDTTNDTARFRSIVDVDADTGSDSNTDENLLVAELAHINLAPVGVAPIDNSIIAAPIPRDITTAIHTALQAFAGKNKKYGIEYRGNSLYLYPNQLSGIAITSALVTTMPTIMGVCMYNERKHQISNGQLCLVAIALWISCTVIVIIIGSWCSNSLSTASSRRSGQTKFLCKLDAAGLTYYHGHIPNTINWDDLRDVNTKLEAVEGPFCTQSLIINQRPGVSLKILVTDALPIDHYQLHQLMQDCVRIVRNEPRYFL